MTPDYSRNTYVLLFSGPALVVGGWVFVDGLAGTALLVAGFAMICGGAIWADVLEEGALLDEDADRTKLALNALSTLGVAGLVLLSGADIVSGPVENALLVVALVVVLGTVYVQRRRREITEFDERELQIRYRAAWSAFTVTMGVLLVGVVAVVALSGTGEQWTPGTTAAVGGALTMVLGALAFKVSEGWYRTRM